MTPHYGYERAREALIDIQARAKNIRYMGLAEAAAQLQADLAAGAWIGREDLLDKAVRALAEQLDEAKGSPIDPLILHHTGMLERTPVAPFGGGETSVDIVVTHVVDGS